MNNILKYHVIPSFGSKVKQEHKMAELSGFIIKIVSSIVNIENSPEIQFNFNFN